MEEKYYTRNNLVQIFLIGLVVGFGLYALWDNRSFITGGEEKMAENNTEQSANNMASSQEQNMQNSDVALADFKIDVNDQPAGLNVILSRVELSESAWIAVYEDDNGEPGNILGARRFQPEDESGDISLLRNTEEGGKYYLVVHADSGDDTFNHEEDSVVEKKGNMIAATFQAIHAR